MKPSRPPPGGYPLPYRPRTPEARYVVAVLERITDESKRTEAMIRVLEAIRPFQRRDRAIRAIGRRRGNVIELAPRGKP